ncbi:Hypothetical protein ETEE_0193 [Edwardsiella anguillarum ET080813]|uniref:Uncharacterized protein n=1 Tax=Edwardsiella anguillarum ET080813 TaxID=667120 RepID=A0A076LER1_9GAMM|nr:Hypothetical protein ETEE_0193 [Edwardsiella anguillarum ET080813]
MPARQLAISIAISCDRRMGPGCLFSAGALPRFTYLLARRRRSDERRTTVRAAPTSMPLTHRVAFSSDKSKPANPGKVSPPLLHVFANEQPIVKAKEIKLEEPAK